MSATSAAVHVLDSGQRTSLGRSGSHAQTLATALAAVVVLALSWCCSVGRPQATASLSVVSIRRAGAQDVRLASAKVPIGPATHHPRHFQQAPPVPVDLSLALRPQQQSVLSSLTTSISVGCITFFLTACALVRHLSTTQTQTTTQAWVFASLSGKKDNKFGLCRGHRKEVPAGKDVVISIGNNNTDGHITVSTRCPVAEEDRAVEAGNSGGRGVTTISPSKSPTPPTRLQLPSKGTVNVPGKIESTERTANREHRTPTVQVAPTVRAGGFAHLPLVDIRIGDNNSNLRLCVTSGGKPTASTSIPSKRFSRPSPKKASRPKLASKRLLSAVTGKELAKDLLAFMEPKMQRLREAIHEEKQHKAAADAKAAKVMRLMSKLQTHAAQAPQLTGWVQELQQRSKVKQLQRQMDVAIKLEDYRLASAIRDQMAVLQERYGDKVHLQRCLQRAIQNNDFVAARKLRDRMKQTELSCWARPLLPTEMAPGTVLLRINPHKRTSMSRPLKRWAVILILQHDESGTRGVVLNHALLSLKDSLMDKFGDELAAIPNVEGEMLFNGGEPLASSIVLLHEQHIGPEPQHLNLSRPLFNLFALLQMANDPNPTFLETLQQIEGEFRIIMGHMTWPPGVIEEEAKEGLWLPAEISPSLIFSDAVGENLWDEVWDLLEEWTQQHMAEGCDTREKSL